MIDVYRFCNGSDKYEISYNINIRYEGTIEENAFGMDEVVPILRESYGFDEIDYEMSFLICFDEEGYCTEILYNVGEETSVACPMDVYFSFLKWRNPYSLAHLHNHPNKYSATPSSADYKTFGVFAKIMLLFNYKNNEGMYIYNNGKHFEYSSLLSEEECQSLARYVVGLSA